MLLRRLRRAGADKATAEAAVTPTSLPGNQASTQPPLDHQHDDEYYDDYYYNEYYEDYVETGTAEPGEEEKENAIKELAEKIGDRMHGKWRSEKNYHNREK